MTLLNRRLTGRTLITVITAVAVLAVGMPMVSAYEAHMINVTCRVGKPPGDTLLKTMRLANETEIDEFLAIAVPMDIPNFPPGRPNPWLDGLMDPPVSDDVVPMNTFILWVVTISVGNTEGYCWTDVIVHDNFSAELGGVPLGSEIVDLFVKTHSKGKSKKEIFETQYRITWYVTCLDDPDNPDDPYGTGECTDNSGEFVQMESAYLQLYLWTKLNPALHQEYTSPGTYTMNSGPTVKWYGCEPPEDHQHSFDGEPLYITVYP